MCMEGNTSGTRPHTSSQHPITIASHPGMTSPSPVASVPLLVDAEAIIDPDIDSVINPATSIQMGSITYDQNENGYNLEWESRDDFDRWLTNEQEAHGIEIQISKVQGGKQLYLSSKTFRCMCNRTGGVKHYKKKTARKERSKVSRLGAGAPVMSRLRPIPISKPYWVNMKISTPMKPARISPDLSIYTRAHRGLGTIWGHK